MNDYINQEMTLEEAIAHLDESLSDQGHDWGCEECRQEHVLLLGWLAELRERRTAKVIPGRWIPVAERVPEPNKEVLVVGKDGEVAIAVWNDKLNYWLNCWANYQVRIVTHWMSLPAPPKEEEE